jgi:peroxiredoxin
MTANVDFELKPLLLPLTPAMLPPAKGEGPLIDQPAPDFTLEDLDGNPVRFSDFRGKPVVLNFWATWCGPCRAEIPHVDALYNKYKDRGLVVIGVNNESDHAKVKAFAEEQISYSVLLDGRAQFEDYSVRGIPCTYYIDKMGIIRYRDVGFGPGEEKKIEQKITELLQEEYK